METAETPSSHPSPSRGEGVGSAYEETCSEWASMFRGFVFCHEASVRECASAQKASAEA
jgi:hypothetical protein